MDDRSKKARPTSAPGKTRAPKDTPLATAISAERVGVVCIGASAGGLEAFTSLLQAMPTDTGLGFVFIPHLAPGHTSMLAEILSRATSMPVCEVSDEPRVEANRVYVIPPGRTMVIGGGRLSLSARDTRPHHVIDRFMTSLAADQGHRAIGVVLSGTANDGTAGLASIKEVGGITFAQDESAQQSGMPHSAIAAGVVDFVLSPERIAREIARVARDPYVAEPADAPAAAPGLEDQILALVRQQSGIDFSEYKSNTLQRRIRRRMVLLKMSRPEDYALYLRSNPVEIEALYQDILISVTNFFRNPEAFEALKTKVIPKLFKNRSRGDPVRVWVLGCSTGEEPYSLAIALTEYATEHRLNIPITIYATDLNNLSVEKSRLGLYPKSIADDVSAERLRHFFVEVDAGYRVTKAIRDLCIFARHNALTDPPFSRMDLISCRNVMIYMEPALQRRLMPILHYALKPNGFLFIGPSETIGSHHELFEPEDAKSRIYAKKPMVLRIDQRYPVAPQSPQFPARSTQAWRESHRDPQQDLQREAERVLLSRYVPAGVLVNAEFEVLQFRGETGHYLTPAPGKPSLNVLKMAREGLLVCLRTLLQRARKEDVAVGEPKVRVKSNGGYHDTSVSVVPVGRSATAERCFWILFEPPRAPAAPRAGPRRAGKTPERAAARRDAQAQEEQIVRLTQELGATREYLQSVIEQQEATNEELQSANEEVQSANEELQSTNEELETSKEEIQSTNEELTTVNEELQHAQSRARSRQQRSQQSLQQHTDGDRHGLARPAHPPLYARGREAVQPHPGRYRPLDLRHSFESQLDNFKALLAEVIENVAVKELEVQDRQGHWYLLRMRPYRTLDNRIDGAIIALVDIGVLKQSQDILQRHARLLEQTHDAVLVRELDGTIVYWNRGAELLYGYPRAEAHLRLRQDLLGGTEQQLKTVELALTASGHWNGELEQRTQDGRELVVESTQVLFREGEQPLVLETSRDVSERRRLEASLRGRVQELAAADRHKNEFLALLAHELRNPLAPLRNATQILKLAGADSPQGVSARQMIERQVYTLSRLVDDLLDAAMVTRGQVKLRIEPIELKKILRQALETTRPLTEARRHLVRLEAPAEPMLVDADAVRLEQVFVNLLTNSAKYTPDGGEISVTVTRLEQAGAPQVQQAVVKVRDNGIGIAPEMVARVFELFVQADQSLARTQGGLGIGLSLARSLVELHGGRLEAYSAGLGQGSEFVVYLPLLRAERARAANKGEGDRAEAPGSAPPTQRVLVVDDNPDIAESTSALLKLNHYEVRAATSAAEAVQVARSFCPTTVLLDIGMPRTDGYQLCQALRASAVTQHARMIAVTGYGGAEMRQRASEAGFDDYLLKPVDLKTLNRILPPRPTP